MQAVLTLRVSSAALERSVLSSFEKARLVTSQSLAWAPCRTCFGLKQCSVLQW